MTVTVQAPPPSPRRVDWKAMYEKHRVKLAVLERAIVREQEQTAVSLSPDATEMILLPFLAELERGGVLPDRTIQATVSKVFANMVQEPDARDSGHRRTAFSVIRAWWQGWCDIPPICRPVDESIGD